MYEQQRRLREPLQWGRRERRIVALLLSCVALAAAGLVAYALSSGAPAKAGCIDVTFASTLGAAKVHQCGARARDTCAAPGAFRGEALEGLKAACARARYPFATR